MSLFTQKTGVGPKVVLLHGWGFNGAVWHPLIEKLKHEYEFSAIDLPGFGKSAEMACEYTPSSLADCIADVIEEGSIVIGWSMGGIIAQQLAVAYPEKVHKLILLACNAQFVANEQWPHGVKPIVLQSFSESLVEDYKVTLHRFLMLQARGGENMKETVREMKHRLFEHGEPDKKALLAGLQLLNETNFLDNLSKIQQQTLIMQGRLDALVPASSGVAMLDMLSSGERYLFDRAAHAPFISHVDEFADVLRAFTKSSQS